MEGAAHNPIATVKFEHNGEKKIMLNYAKLRIIRLIGSSVELTNYFITDIYICMVVFLFITKPPHVICQAKETKPEK